MKNAKKVDFANTLRGIAALSVLFFHYFGVFWSSRSAVSSLINAPELSLVTHPSPYYMHWLSKISLVNFGSYGVALFFIISGFVIPFSLQKQNRFDFCVGRIFRIIPLYIFGFSFTLLMLFLSVKYFNSQWPYYWREILIHYIPGLRDIMWSRNIDGIIWTLEIEMKFYLICVLVFNSFRHYSQKIFLVPIILFLLAICCMQKLPSWQQANLSTWKLAMTYITSSQYIIFMFIGVFFHYLFCQKIEPSKGYLGIASLFTLFCIDWWVGPYSDSLSLAWSYGFALLTFMYAYSYPKLFQQNRLVNFFADISYPLYVIHGLAGYVLLRILLDKGYKAWFSLMIVSAGIIFISWLLHKFIEQPTQLLGKKISANLNNLDLSAYKSTNLSRFLLGN